MKILIGLSLLQTIAIIVLIAMGGANSGSVQQQSAGAAIVLPQRQASQSELSNQSPSSFDEERLRSVIREELAAQQQNVNRGQDGAAKLAVPDAQAAAQMRNQSQLVAQKIEGYKGVGAVTNRQMQELLGEIDQLDEQNRAQMMSALARAINTGALKGRL
jgi:hypothetical protein